MEQAACATYLISKSSHAPISRRRRPCGSPSRRSRALVRGIPAIAPQNVFTRRGEWVASKLAALKLARRNLSPPTVLYGYCMATVWCTCTVWLLVVLLYASDLSGRSMHGKMAGLLSLLSVSHTGIPACR